MGRVIMYIMYAEWGRSADEAEFGYGYRGEVADGACVDGSGGHACTYHVWGVGKIN